MTAPNSSWTKFSSVTKGSFMFSREIVKGIFKNRPQVVMVPKAFGKFMNPLFLNPDCRVPQIRELESIVSDFVKNSMKKQFDLQVIPLGQPIDSPKRGSSIPVIEKDWFFPGDLDFSLQKHFINECYPEDLPKSHKYNDPDGRYFPKLYIYRKKENDTGKYLVYYTGGAFLLTHHTYFCHLSKYFPEHNLVFVSYALAPEFNYPQGILDSIDAYYHILKLNPTSICIAGESAGGNMCLHVGVYTKEHFPSMDINYMAPKCIVLMSPFSDMTLSGGSIDKNGDYDAIKPSFDFGKFRELYLGMPLYSREELLFVEVEENRYKSLQVLTKDDLTRRIFSPHNYNELLNGLPPVNVHTGDKEILLSDNYQLVNKLERHGVECQWTIYEDQVHMWQSFSWLKSAKDSYLEAQQFINKYL